ncbi:MAG: FAD-dependent monooxygenase [Bacillota bacterium]|nr:FAD-dependent monooxygenase [Bacillota bacterium]
MIRTERDVIVIGGGPAGAICASYLAMKGVDVLLLDKDIFPRDKACGDILQEGIVSHIEAVGAFDALDRAGSCIRSLRLISGSGAKAQVPFECYCAPRYKVDEMLVRAAVKHGAEVRQGCHVTDIVMENGYVRGVRVRYRGEEAELRCKVVIGADGACSLTAKLLGVMKEEPSGAYFGWRAYFKGVKLDRSLAVNQYNTYGVFSFYPDVRPGCFWTVPCGKESVTEGFCNVGFVLRGRNAGGEADAEELFNKWAASNPELSAMFREARRISAWKGGKLCDTTQGIRNVGNGFILIGDAGSQMMPLYFDGLSAAADSARAAADAATAAIDSGDVSENLLGEAYTRAMKPYMITEDEIKVRRLMLESMYDSRTMDNVIRHLDRDPAYCRKVMKSL